MEKKKIKYIGGIILDASIRVYKELEIRDIFFRMYVTKDLIYKGVSLNKAYRMDFLVEEKIIIEIKSTEYINPVSESQLITYLKLADKKPGCLINFTGPY